MTEIENAYCSVESLIISQAKLIHEIGQNLRAQSALLKSKNRRTIR